MQSYEKTEIRKHFTTSTPKVLDNEIRQEIIISSISNNNTNKYIVPGTVLISYIR